MTEDASEQAADIAVHLQRVLEALRLNGLLLESDAALPSVVTLVAGEPVRGSWWGHQDGGLIYAVTQELPRQPDVLVTKLVSGKLTYVHRLRWSALLCIATAREGWQMRNLSEAARVLLRLVDERGELATNVLALSGEVPGGRIGDTVRDLERRLLLHSNEVHTESGAHAKLLSSWARWLESVGPLEVDGDVEVARGEFERVVAALNGVHQGKGRLPWPVSAG